MQGSYHLVQILEAGGDLDEFARRIGDKLDIEGLNRYAEASGLVSRISEAKG
jgi:hypothetical protein